MRRREQSGLHRITPGPRRGAWAVGLSFLARGEPHTLVRPDPKPKPNPNPNPNPNPDPDPNPNQVGCTTFKRKEINPVWAGERLQFKLALGGQIPPAVRVTVRCAD